ncbi:hypothetical protein VRK_20080 [Vibrio sp. MEBiC08052]|nr:hypothetical protein VRK_20080 [Vibrio sp. MEBiC08052]
MFLQIQLTQTEKSSRDITPANRLIVIVFHALSNPQQKRLTTKTSRILSIEA